MHNGHELSRAAIMALRIKSERLGIPSNASRRDSSTLKLMTSDLLLVAIAHSFLSFSNSDSTHFLSTASQSNTLYYTIVKEKVPAIVTLIVAEGRMVKPDSCGSTP